MEKSVAIIDPNKEDISWLSRSFFNRKFVGYFDGRGLHIFSNRISS
jgi:hypothetical protein